MTDTQTVPARDLRSGDFINGARVTHVDADTTPGVIYVWTSAHDVDHAAAHMIFHHADPVRIERVAAMCSNGCGQPATCGPTSFGLSSRCARHEHLPSDYA